MRPIRRFARFIGNILDLENRVAEFIAAIVAMLWIWTVIAHPADSFRIISISALSTSLSPNFWYCYTATFSAVQIAGLVGDSGIFGRNIRVAFKWVRWLAAVAATYWWAALSYSISPLVNMHPNYSTYAGYAAINAFAVLHILKERRGEWLRRN